MPDIQALRLELERRLYDVARAETYAMANHRDALVGVGTTRVYTGEVAPHGTETLYLMLDPDAPNWREYEAMAHGAVVDYTPPPRLIALAIEEELADQQCSRTGRCRPAPAGVSIGHVRITAGTFTGVVTDAKSGDILGASNNHVIALDWCRNRTGRKGDPIVQPGPYDGGRDPRDRVGFLERWVRVYCPGEGGQPGCEAGGRPANCVDSAVFKPLQPWRQYISEVVLGTGAKVGPRHPNIDELVGQQVCKSGRTTGIRCGKIVSTNATVRVYGWGIAVFTRQIIVRPAIGAPGDSGSYTYLPPQKGQQYLTTVGQLFAGSPFVTVHCRADEIERLLGIRFGRRERGRLPPIPRGASLAMAALGFAAIAGSVIAPSEPGRW